MTTWEQAVRKTYRYLRVGIVGLALLLLVSIAIEITEGDSGRLDSISAYFYTPVRGIFVGTLVAVGLSLVAIRGRTDAEDILLNLAGMLLPVVALVPTPLLAGDTSGRYVPGEFLASIENNVTALLVVGAVALAFGAWTAFTDDRGRLRAALVGVATSAAAWAGFAGWFALGRGSFLVAAHYAAAVLFFGCVIAVTWSSARYRVIGALMIGCLGVALVLFVLQSRGVEPISGWVFFVEAVLLVLFTAYWVAQTVEHWNAPDAGLSRY